MAREVWTKPLSSLIVEETLGVGKPHDDVAGEAGVLEDRLHGEPRLVPGGVVRAVQDGGGR